MQLKTIFTASAAVALALTGWQISNADTSANALDYTPRVEEAKSQAPDGAWEIQQKMLGDIETGEINSEGLRELRGEVTRFAAQQSLDGRATDHYWNEMGPDNIGGRTRAIAAVIPEDGSEETVLYAGAISGGLWKSDNGGNDWNQMFGLDQMVVGSVAVAGNGAVYVGSGSIYDGGSGDGGSGFRGRGIWWSADGENFELVEGTDPGEFNSGDFSAVDAMVADPNFPNRVWFGSNAGYGFIDDGVMTMSPSDDISGAVGDIAIAADGSYMLIGMNNCRVFRSDDNTFTTFTSMSGSNNDETVLPQSGNGRVRVAISLDDSNHAFAVFATSGGLFGGLYHTGNAGDIWSNVWPNEIDEATPLPRAQGIYDLALGVKKGQPDLAYVGGIELWRSGPNQQAELAAYAFDFAGTNIDVHADVHEVMFTPSGNMYVATDGGIYKSTDGGMSYNDINRDYSVTQFYGMDHSARSAVLGGTQDNGSLFIPANGYYLSDQEAVEVQGGDGFDCAISQVTEAEGYDYAFYATSQNGGLGRGTVGQDDIANYGSFFDANITELANDEGEIGQFYSVVRLYENTDDQDSQRSVVLVNPFGETVTDSTFTLSTSNQNLDFEYTLPEGVELAFYEELVRPERLLDAPLTEDPDYFWMDPQESIEQLECNDDSVLIGQELQITDIAPVVDSVYIAEWDEWVYNTVGYDTTFSEVDVYEVNVVCDTMYFHASDTMIDVPGRLLVNDPYTTMTIAGFNGGNGIWMTRDGLNFNTTPEWVRLDNAPAGVGTKAVEFTVNIEPEAGNHMFVSGWDGKLYRFDGMEDIHTQDDVPANMGKQIRSLGAVITGVSVDPNNPNHVVISVGGYGALATGKVQETFNALDDQPSWSSIWNESGLSKMPCYDVIIDAMDPSGQSIVVGTEYGIFATDNGGDDWMMANQNMASTADQISAPVFDVKQQWRGAAPWINPSNQGAIYAATHGRGIFRSDLFLGVDEPTEMASQEASSLMVYPNPVSGGTFSVQSETFKGDFQLQVFDITGRLNVDQAIRGYAGGPIVVDASGLENGQYIVRLTNGKFQKTAKLLVR
ncbi:MAG: T9SS type A sorting domain-containing protein [Crocinitomicaceae bacterium]|nr:T9SS type A sorting domain-containing protein [Crocinitomicaceae bacterium]